MTHPLNITGSATVEEAIDAPAPRIIRVSYEGDQAARSAGARPVLEAALADAPVSNRSYFHRLCRADDLGDEITNRAALSGARVHHLVDALITMREAVRHVLASSGGPDPIAEWDRGSLESIVSEVENGTASVKLYTAHPTNTPDLADAVARRIAQTGYVAVVERFVHAGDCRIVATYGA